jgi:hypothetical protein
MNMKDTPTAVQLTELLGNADDQAGHHILWVSKGGQVNLDQLPSDLTPGGWAEQNRDLQFRFETYQLGNDYVGKAAATDPAYVDKLLRQMLRHWELGTVGHIDY